MQLDALSSQFKHFKEHLTHYNRFKKYPSLQVLQTI
jgi:hypothetical protein